MNKRTIKFRAWDGEVMIEWENLQEINLQELTLGIIDQEETQLKIIIMQFTGLKDNTGKEIYEGDKVQVSDTLTNQTFSGYVSFIDASFVIKSEYMTHYRWQDYDCQVVGNIFEDGK